MAPLYIFRCQGILSRKAQSPFSMLTEMPLACVMAFVHFSRSAAINMDPNLVFIAIGLFFATAAWKKWPGERRSIPRIWSALFLFGLCGVSLALIQYSLFIFYVHRIGGFGANFAAMLSWARPGFFLSLIALILNSTGQGRSRIFAVAVSSELLVICIILVSGM